MCKNISKIKWQCRRGMLELDLILNRFLESGFHLLTPHQVGVFESLLHTADPLLYHWLIGSDNPADRELCALVEFIRMQDSLS